VVIEGETQMPVDLELRHVCKRFGEVLALDEVSLEIQRGEFVTLLGPSGCGKTTTLRIVAGLEHETSGAVLIRGEPVNHLPPYRRNVNTVFQNYALFPHFTVFQNVAFGLRLKRWPRAEINRAVEQALEQVHLTGYGERRPHELSGGQQQRIALARALVNQPAILLLDEPLGALDLKLRKEMQLELKRVHREVGITFIYVTHDQEEALTLSDRIVVMNASKVVQVGTPLEVYEQPQTTFVANFVGVSNILEASICALETDAPVIGVAPAFRFKKPVRAKLPTGQPLIIAVRPEKVRLTSGEGLKGQIEDVVYLGNRVISVVRLDTGTLVHAESQAGSPNGGLTIGQPVAVGWHPSDCRLYDPAGGILIE
jgi:spermidine/putrescine transport system ATP-binding protein